MEENHCKWFAKILFKDFYMTQDEIKTVEEKAPQFIKAKEPYSKE